MRSRPILRVGSHEVPGGISGTASGSGTPTTVARAPALPGFLLSGACNWNGGQSLDVEEGEERVWLASPLAPRLGEI